MTNPEPELLRASAARRGRDSFARRRVPFSGGGRFPESASGP